MVARGGLVHLIVVVVVVMAAKMVVAKVVVVVKVVVVFVVKVIQGDFFYWSLECSVEGSNSKNQNSFGAGHPLGVPRTGIQWSKCAPRSISYRPNCFEFALVMWILM